MKSMIVSLALALAAALPSTALAQDNPEVDKLVEKMNRQMSELQKEIDRLQKEIDDLTGQLKGKGRPQPPQDPLEERFRDLDLPPLEELFEKFGAPLEGMDLDRMLEQFGAPLEGMDLDRLLEGLGRPGEGFDLDRILKELEGPDFKKLMEKFEDDFKGGFDPKEALRRFEREFGGDFDFDLDRVMEQFREQFDPAELQRMMEEFQRMMEPEPSDADDEVI